MKKYKLILLAVLFSAGIVSCSSDDDAGEVNSETANVRIAMTDAPGDYDKVIVEVVDVMVQTDASLEDPEADEEGWVSLEGVQTGPYDLLQLTGGLTQLLAEAEIPAGRLNQIRLVLGSGNKLEVNGQFLSLETPSAQQSGLKLQVNQDLVAGEDYYFLLDFDVEQSIVEAGGSGNYILKPVIRVSTHEAGSISGTVHPTTQKVYVTAVSATATISAYTDTDGNFTLHGVPAGIYEVTITPEEASGYTEAVIKNVVVVEGEETVVADTRFE